MYRRKNPRLRKIYNFQFILISIPVILFSYFFYSNHLFNKRAYLAVPVTSKTYFPPVLFFPHISFNVLGSQAIAPADIVRYVNIERNDVTPMNWSFGWKPVGYINYQYPDNVSKEDPNPACGSGGPYEGQCDRVPDYTKCRDNNNSYKSEFRNFGDNNVIRGDYPNNAARVAIFCMPEDNNARIDLVFEKELYTISGKVFFGTNADGIKQSTESYYNSNTKNVINLTGTATSARPTDANGIYSFTKLKPGNYTVIFNPVPNGYQLTTTNPVIVNNLNSDRIIDFGLGPTPWLQTIDGDVHSNTQINAPGGP